MKKILIALISLMFMGSTFAYDSAKLKLKIAGPIKDNRYYLCISNAGCISMLAANKGKAFHMDAGKIRNIFAFNMVTTKLYAQPLPSSCDVNLDNQQTVVISGKLVEGPNKTVYLNNLSCKVQV